MPSFVAREAFFQISAALGKSALAIHKTSVGFFAELLNQLWIDFHRKIIR